VTGYAGFELTRLLLRHPRVSPPTLFYRAAEGAPAKQLSDLFPQVSGNGSYPMEPFSWSKLRAESVDLLFLATPHEVSREWVPEAIQRGVRVIDLSGAWRLRQADHRTAYGFEDADPEAAQRLTDQAVYGLPELNRKRLRQAQLVANPGCYATSIILALAPLLQAGLVELEHGVVCDAKSGVSGAGKQPSATTHFVEVADNLSAYSVFRHRHVGEILEQLRLPAEQLVFVPHLLPIPRGILCTLYLRLLTPLTAPEVEACLRAFYRESPWVRVFAPPQLPQIQFSLRTNFCDLGFCLAEDGRRLVLISCLDNLLKGAAGQAVQNMNVMCGWNEKEGLA
jgi:N-acetyl-gamma-glutamyl-phosphate reductase